MNKKTKREVFINAELVCLGLQAAHWEDAITKLAEMLHAQGAVQPGYAAAACLREKIYPTGLPTENVYTALPHADADLVIFDAIALATCNPPIMFHNMANPEEELPVEVVIMAVVTDGKRQVKMLKLLSEVLAEPETLAALRDASTREACAGLLKSKLQ